MTIVHSLAGSRGSLPRSRSRSRNVYALGCFRAAAGTRLDPSELEPHARGGGEPGRGSSNGCRQPQTPACSLALPISSLAQSRACFQPCSKRPVAVVVTTSRQSQPPRGHGLGRPGNPRPRKRMTTPLTLAPLTPGPICDVTKRRGSFQQTVAALIIHRRSFRDSLWAAWPHAGSRSTSLFKHQRAPAHAAIAIWLAAAQEAG